MDLTSLPRHHHSGAGAKTEDLIASIGFGTKRNGKRDGEIKYECHVMLALTKGGISVPHEVAFIVMLCGDLRRLLLL